VPAEIPLGCNRAQVARSLRIAIGFTWRPLSMARLGARTGSSRSPGEVMTLCPGYRSPARSPPDVFQPIGIGVATAVWSFSHRCNRGGHGE